MPLQYLPHVIESTTRFGHNSPRGEGKGTWQNPYLSRDVKYVAELNRFGKWQRRPSCCLHREESRFIGGHRKLSRVSRTP